MVKYLFDDIKRSGCARAPRTQHRGGRLEGKRIAAGIERPVHECEQTRAGVGKIDRGAEHKSVCAAGLLYKAVDAVVEHARTGLPAFTAANAVGQRLIANEDLLGLNALFAERTRDLGERRMGAPVGPRAAIDQ